MVFFFSSRRRHTRYWRDWSSDVCSSDLVEQCPLTGVAGTVDGELGLEEHMHVAKVLRDGEILGRLGGTGGDSDLEGAQSVELNAHRLLEHVGHHLGQLGEHGHYVALLHRDR